MFVTPLAYTIPSPQKGLGKPVVAYHYLDGDKSWGIPSGIGYVGLSIELSLGTRETLHEDGTPPV